MWYINLTLLALLNGVLAFMTYADAALKKSLLKTVAQVMFWALILVPTMYAVASHRLDYRSETGVGLGAVASAALIIFVTIFAAKRPQKL